MTPPCNLTDLFRRVADHLHAGHTIELKEKG